MLQALVWVVILTFFELSVEMLTIFEIEKTKELPSIDKAKKFIETNIAKHFPVLSEASLIIGFITQMSGNTIITPPIYLPKNNSDSQ